MPASNARALANRYLGRGADASLFPGGSGPDAFFAITLHTLELISPVAMTWRKPVVTFSALPVRGQSAADKLRMLNDRTQEAAADVMTNWARKTIVMVWEHHHIADQKLADSFRDQKVTLRQLLNLEAVDSAPKTWPDENYDYFWMVDYDAGSPRPTRFEMVKQSFPVPYQQLPSNDWGKKALLPRGCKN
jgi:hypothetical protein